MIKSFISSVSLPHYSMWDRLKSKRTLYSFDLELTPRCNNNCTHCYINLPADDREAIKRELTFDELKPVIDEAVSLGALWCLLTGGEPLLREDFFDIYLYLKRKGLLVSLFTNGALITDKHIRLFEKYPPRDIEITVYGATEKTCEKVTRTPGSFRASMRGINMLLQSGINVRLKAMALRMNYNEMPFISEFCRRHTKDYFRFDPFLHLRYDRDETRNREIRKERLTSEEIIILEGNDPHRLKALEKKCERLLASSECNYIFRCGAGNKAITLGYDGTVRLCAALFHSKCIYSAGKRYEVPSQGIS